MTEGSPDISTKVAELNRNLENLKRIRKLWEKQQKDCQDYLSKISDIMKNEAVTAQVGEPDVNGGERNKVSNRPGA